MPRKRKAVSIAMCIGPDTSSWQGALLTRVLYDDGSVDEQWNVGPWVPVKPATTAPEVPDAT